MVHATEAELVANCREIARITQKFTAKGYLIGADDFTIEFFDQDMKSELKACLLGALFVIDYTYYEYYK